MKTHLIMPMGGAGSRFFENGYKKPKPLIKIKEKPFFYWATMSIKKYIDIADLTFVVLQQHIDEFNIDKEILLLFPEAKIRVLNKILPGPVFTCLEGVKDITDEGPILFNDCDHMFKCDEINEVLNNESFIYDGALLSFVSDEAHYSYIQYDEDNNIIGTREKKVVSNHAICGAYVFKNVNLFKTTVQKYLQCCPYNEYFMSGLYNIMCNQGMKIKNYQLDYHVEFGTPKEYEKAIDSMYFYDLL